MPDVDRSDPGVRLGACPACGSARRRAWLRHPRLALWLCAGCGLGYTDPQPQAFVEWRYRHDYDLAAHFGAVAQRKATLIERRLDRLPSDVTGRRLLDAGCADGQFAAAARRRGWEPTGVELNPPAAQRARDQGVDVIEGDVQTVDLPAAAYDVVTAWDVIEHVPAPRAFVDRLSRLVAPGGVLVLTTLNRRALVARAFGSRWSMLVEDHFTYWDAASLQQAFAATGLRPERATSFGLGRDFVAGVDRRRRRSAAGPTPPASGSATATGAAPWDTRRAVLALERAANRVLDATSLGVGIEVVLRAPHLR